MRSYKSTLHQLIGAVGALSILLIASCSSFTADRDSSETEQGSSQAGRETEQTMDPDGGKEKVPAKEWPGGVDAASEAFRELCYTLPKEGKPVFIAAVPRRANREEEYEYALWDIARQAAIFQKVDVSAQFITAQTTAEFGHDERIDVEVDNGLIEKMRDEVVPLEHYRDSQLTLVKAYIDSFSVPNYRVDSAVRNNLPVWVLNPPNIEGCYTTVGSAEKRSRLSKSLRAADKKAMANLARQRRLKIDNLSDQMKWNAGSAYREFNLEVSEASLEGYYVLARWFSPEENLYYTLAVCSKAE